MELTNLILSSIFTLEIQSGGESNAFKPPENIVTNNVFIDRNSDFSDEEITKTLEYVQSFNLIFQDILIYTKEGLYKEYTSGGQSYTAYEMNPVANLFFKNNLWNAAFVSANAFNYFMFNNKYISTVYSIALYLAEIWAISTWQPTTTRVINVNAIIYEYMF